MRLEKNMMQLREESKLHAEEKQKHEKEIKRLQDEREKLKIRVSKLIKRKGTFNSGEKTCKNCTKEFIEKRISTGPAGCTNLTGVARCGGAAGNEVEINQAASSVNTSRKTMKKMMMMKKRHRKQKCKGC